MRLPSLSIAIPIALLAGLALGWLIWGRPTGDAPAPTRPTPDAGRALAAQAPAPEEVPPSSGTSPGSRSGERGSEVAALRAALAREIARRTALEQDLAALPRTGSGEGDASEPLEPVERAGAGGFVDERALLAAGFEEWELEALSEHIESIELRRLFVRDRATREGWVDKPRFRSRMKELDAEYHELRDEFGDDGYDWILYTSGRNNRVVVNHVMQDSPAALAGLERGDVLTHYGGERIFAPAVLRQATTEGAPGSNVAVEFLRPQEDGGPAEWHRIFVPRGPLGIRLAAKNLQPDHGR